MTLYPVWDTHTHKHIWPLTPVHLTKAIKHVQRGSGLNVLIFLLESQSAKWFPDSPERKTQFFRRCFELYILLDISSVTYSNLGRLMQNVRTTTVTFTGIWAHTALKPARRWFQYIVKYSEVLENKRPDQTQHIDGSCYQISTVLRLWHLSWLQLCCSHSSIRSTRKHPAEIHTDSKHLHQIWL